MYKYILLMMSMLLTGFTSHVSAQVSDPTRPFSYSGTSVELANNKLVLQSIIRGENINTAVINGKVMQEGATLGQYQIAQINDDNVVLQSESENIKLYIFKNKVLK